jgi:hypothetical protein
MNEEKKKYEGNATLKNGEYGEFWAFGIRREAVDEWLRNNPDEQWMNGSIYPGREPGKGSVRVFTNPRRKR